MKLATRMEPYRGIPVLYLSQELTLVVKTEFEAALDQLARAGDCVIVDLADVDFVDSSALGLIIRFDVQLSARKGALALASLQPEVTRILQVTRLIAHLNVFDGLDAAVEYLHTICGPTES